MAESGAESESVMAVSSVSTTEDDRRLGSLQQKMGVQLPDLDILRQAFVHRSFVNELVEAGHGVVDNERLEFLGDSALGLVVSDIVYRRFPHYTEGELTRVRSMVVRRETLAELAAQLGLGDYLQLGRGEDESGGRYRPAILCATFEAVIGAVYLNLGLEGVFRVVEPLLDSLLVRWDRETGYKDAKSLLQEWTQSRYGVAPRYKVIDEDGPDHAKIFVIQVTLLQQRIGVGIGLSKQEASQQAAHMALIRLGQLGDLESDSTRQLAAQWGVPDDVQTLLQEVGE